MPVIKGNLKEADFKKIQENYSYLLAELDSQHLANFLFEHNIFTHDDKIETSNLYVSRRNRTDLFLTRLLHSGPGKAFDVFMQALEKDYPHVAKRLREGEGEGDQQLPEAAGDISTDSASELPEHFVEIDPKEIKKETHRILGNGAYGVVNLAKWKDRDVAIKLFERMGKSFQHELEQLTKVRHENIIRVYGKYYPEGKEATGPYMAGLVMEYSKDGSLQYVVFDSDDQYTRADALSWCRQCAQGVEYLHNIKPKAILHRDLKPANLLLFNERKVLKLCDFGLARDIKTTMTKFRGTAVFIAPEVSKGEKYNEKCDVFSFGVTVWVTLKRGPPKSKKMLGIPTADTSLMGRGTIDNLPQELEKLMESCWAINPLQRPKMTEIVTILSTPEQYFKDGSLQEVVPKDSSTSYTASSDESSD